MGNSKPTPDAHGVTPGEAKRLTVQFIGVDAGYLGDFNRGELERFYLQHGLDFDIYEFEGTTRERFIGILLAATPSEQARILRGVVDRFPIEEGPASRNAAMRDWVEQIADRVDGHLVAAVVPGDATDAVRRAIADAETLLGTTGATSALDRVHTALHGYLRAACEAAGIVFKSDDPSTGALWGALRKGHPRLQPSGPRAADVESVLQGLARIIDALSPIRNRASLAHANSELLDDAEARLALNAARTALGYIESKLR